MLYQIRETDLEELLMMYCTQLLGHSFKAMQTFTLENRSYSIAIGRADDICTVCISTGVEDIEEARIKDHIQLWNSKDIRGFLSSVTQKGKTYLTYIQRLVMEDDAEIKMDTLTNVVDLACTKLKKVKEELEMENHGIKETGDTRI